MPARTGGIGGRITAGPVDAAAVAAMTGGAAPAAAGRAPGSVLIPAAGASRRMGGEDKLLRRIDGIAQLRRIALGALATGWPVIVTLPPGDRDRRAALAGLELTLLEPADHAEGMAASLRAGARQARGGALMVVPADMPGLCAEDLARMCRRHHDLPQAILRGGSDSGPGHPVLFPADLLDGIALLTGDAGARPLLARHAGRVVAVPLPFDRATRDLDTPADWAAWESAAPPAPQMTPGARILPDPVADALRYPGEAVIAVITGVEGPSYRDVGTLMCFFADGGSSGNLTNGCIEADLALHARDALRRGTPLRLRYGSGSPFFDIRLPCGGGLDIALFPLADRQPLRDAVFLRDGRAAIGLGFGPDGLMRLAPPGATGWRGETFVVTLLPEPRAMIFGDGEEARTTARLFSAAGFPLMLFTAAAPFSGACGDAVPLAPQPPAIRQALCLADPWTAIMTLYHDHEKELAILAEALRGPAFYVGAQGSVRVRDKRNASLRDAGLDEGQLARLHAPIGVLPSAREPRSLAVSILAEVVAESRRMMSVR